MQQSTKQSVFTDYGEWVYDEYDPYYKQQSIHHPGFVISVYFG